MALTLNAYVQVDVVDYANIAGTLTAYLLLDPSLSLSEVDDLFDAWLIALDNVTGAQILDYRVVLLPGVPGGLKSTPEDNCNAMQTGTLNFSAVGTNKRWGFAIPALSNSSSVQNGGLIVTTPGSPVAILQAAMLVDSPTDEWTNDQYQALEAVLNAFLSFRKYTEQLARGSFTRA